MPIMASWNPASGLLAMLADSGKTYATAAFSPALLVKARKPG